LEVIMSTTDLRSEPSTEVPVPATIDMKLEVVNVPVSDVDRAKRFYESLGWRWTATSPSARTSEPCNTRLSTRSARSPSARGSQTAAPGSLQDLMLIVDDIDAARDDLISRGVDVSEIYHYETRPFHSAGTDARVPGPDPQGRSYFTWASFSDPDGNGWLMQQIKTRLPGREWED
jgi:catechol 2,3-dioxygenase-like lactoylglutathione lyase family enzyme